MYYFDVSIYHKDIPFPHCYGTHINTNGRYVHNWQLMTDEEIDGLLNHVIEKILIPIIDTPFAELGGKVEIWQGCTCSREKCNTCWVQKNLWEANGGSKNERGY